MERYFIILNKSEFEPNVARDIYYHTGKMKYSFKTKTKQRDFDKIPHYGGGFHFTDENHVNEYYMNGVWIREVNPITHNTDIIEIKEGLYKADEIELLSRYSLEDLETYNILNIPIPPLKWFVWFDCPNAIKQLHNLGLLHNSDCCAIDYAMWLGKVHMLDLLDDLLPEEQFLYSEMGMDYASRYNHVNVLEWMLISSETYIPKYSNLSLEYATQVGQTDVLNWWYNSNLKLKIETNTIREILKYSSIKATKWWKEKFEITTEK